MTMEYFNILHITDLHFGQEYSYENTSDIKDKTLSETIKNNFNDRWQSIFFDSISRWQNQNEKIEFIAFTGDLAQSGNITQEERRKRIELGLVFLIELCKKLSLSLDRLIISPGNHDLDRNNKLDQFQDLKELCKKHNINNYSTDNIFSVEVKPNIKIFSINSCLGATEKVESFDDQYYSKHLEELRDQKDKTFEDINRDEFIYQKDLDIPAIGDKQNRDLLDQISNIKLCDSCILLMHHNPLPTASIEIRPYSNVIDGGRLIKELLETGKKIFILHGHTHFESSITSFLPDSQDNNYIATIGGAALNGSDRGKASILKFLFLDQMHLKTDIYEVRRDSSTFNIRPKFQIYNISDKLDLGIAWNKLTSSKKYSFISIKEELEYTGDDEKLIRSIIFLTPKNIKIGFNDSDDYKNWSFYKLK